jgi:hypothetical protein
MVLKTITRLFHFVLFIFVTENKHFKFIYLHWICTAVLLLAHCPYKSVNCRQLTKLKNRLK